MVNIIVNKEVDAFVIENYHKMQNNEIRKKLKISDYLLLKIVRENNLKLKGSGNKNTWDVDLTPNKEELTDYLLGLIAADGCITYKTNSLDGGGSYRVAIGVTDKELIDIFKLKFPKASYYLDNRSIKNPKWKDIHIGYFNNKKIIDKFIDIGITPKKANNINYRYINADFLRGYFDGDGSVRVRNNSIETKITSNSKKQIINFQEFLTTYDIKSSIGFSRNSYDLFIYNKINNRKLFDLMYQNKQYLLTRKYKVFADYFSDEICKMG